MKVEDFIIVKIKALVRYIVLVRLGSKEVSIMKIMPRFGPLMLLVYLQYIETTSIQFNHIRILFTSL